MNHEFLFLAKTVAQHRGIPFHADPSLWGELDEEHVNEFLLCKTAQQHKSAASLNIDELKHKQALDAAARMLMLTQWEKLHEVLRGVPAVILKGASSSLQLYGNPMVREYTDIDILTDRDITDIIAPLGWKCITEAAEGAVIQQPKHLVYEHQDTPFRLEAHREIYAKGEFSAAELLERRVVLRWNDTVIPSLSLADHGVYIIMHGVKHAWCLLHWLFDLAKFMMIEDQQLHGQTAELLCRLNRPKHLKLSVELLQSIFPVPVPEVYLPLIPANLNISSQLRFCRDALERGGRNWGKAGTILRLYYTYHLPLARGWREKLETAVRLWKVPPRDIKALPLPRALQPLHLLLRPFFIIGRRISPRRKS